ncbi:MAG: pantetheine-phosphate adenylyltransferase [Candidatus Omnitrophica bacterium]|nr:pantetheine-phosphate adenylyltransferase [Candidatus Omnitrophota bacterium]
MSTKVIYPGTFDPITNGHIDIIERASRIYDKVIVSVAENDPKKPMFSVQERVDMVSKAVSNMDRVTVESFKGLLIDYVRSKKVRVVVRGLRMISDFEYEFQMALMNRKIAPDIETIFMMPKANYSYLSSKLIKEAAQLGADISVFVPSFVEKEIKRKMSNIGK